MRNIQELARRFYWFPAVKEERREYRAIRRWRRNKRLHELKNYKFNPNELPF